MAYTSKKEKGKGKVTDTEKNILREYLKKTDFSGYLKAEEVRGKSLSEIWSICKSTNKFHVSLVRKLSALFGIDSYQASIDSMNTGLEKVVKTFDK